MTKVKRSLDLDFVRPNLCYLKTEINRFINVSFMIFQYANLSSNTNTDGSN